MVRARQIDPVEGAHAAYAETYAKWLALNAALDRMSI